MPIVAGMGGNAGTQVLALMVRGLALGQVSASNVRVLLWKEVRVALINGIVLGTPCWRLIVWCGSEPGLVAGDRQRADASTCCPPPPLACWCR
jgi:magnesium transporter